MNSSIGDVGLEHDIILWGSEPDGTRTSFWLAPTADSFRTIARRNDVVLAVEDSLWLWQERRREEPLFNCTKVERADYHAGQIKPSGSIEVIDGVLVRLGAHDEHVAVKSAPIHDPSDTLYPEFHEQSLSLIGTVGPYLFVLERSGGYWCGSAHPNFSRRFVLWNMETMHEERPFGRLFTTKDYRSLRWKERRKARKILAGELSDYVGHEAELDIEEVNLEAMIPRYNDNRIEFEYIFATFTCYACGDGEWSDYYNAVRIKAKKPLEFVALYVEAPVSVRAFANEHPGFRVGGWTFLRGKPISRQRELEVFSRSESEPKIDPESQRVEDDPDQ